MRNKYVSVISCAAARNRKGALPIFRSEDISPLDVSVQHTLIVQVFQPFQHLGDVDG
jgi:hypothetical protein